MKQLVIGSNHITNTWLYLQLYNHSNQFKFIPNNCQLLPLANYYALFREPKTINWNFNIETHLLLNKTKNNHQTALSKAAKHHLQTSKADMVKKEEKKKQEKTEKKKLNKFQFLIFQSQNCPNMFFFAAFLYEMLELRWSTAKTKEKSWRQL